MVPRAKDIEIGYVTIAHGFETLIASLFKSLDFIYQQCLLLIKGHCKPPYTERKCINRENTLDHISKNLLQDTVLDKLMLKEPHRAEEYQAVLDVPEPMRIATARLAITIYKTWMYLWHKHTEFNFAHPSTWSFHLVPLSSATWMKPGKYKDLLCPQAIIGDIVPDVLPDDGPIALYRTPKNKFLFQMPKGKTPRSPLPPSFAKEWGTLAKDNIFCKKWEQ